MKSLQIILGEIGSVSVFFLNLWVASDSLNPWPKKKAKKRWHIGSFQAIQVPSVQSVF